MEVSAGTEPVIAAYLNENGTMFLTGRCSTLIQKDDKIIYPFIYENYFQTIDGVEIGTVMLLKEKITALNPHPCLLVLAKHKK